MRDRHARAFAQEFEPAERGMESPAMPEWLAGSTPTGRTCTPPCATPPRWATPTRRCSSSPRSGATGACAAALAEARALAAAALALGGEPELRVAALNGAGVLAAEHGDFAAAREHFAAALELAREIGSHHRVVRVTPTSAAWRCTRATTTTAIARYQEATEHAREQGNARHLSLTLHNLAIAHDGAGHPEAAIRLPRGEPADRPRGRGAGARHAPSRCCSPARCSRSDPTRAAELARASLARAHVLGDMNGLPPLPGDRRAS